MQAEIFSDLVHLLGVAAYAGTQIPVVSFTNMKIQVTLCKLDFEGLQVGAHIFEKIFSCYKILFETADGMAPLVAPCHLLSQTYLL